MDGAQTDHTQRTGSAGKGTDQEFLRRIARALGIFWSNRPVGDENAFAEEFRLHAFAGARTASWVAAIIGSVLTLHRNVEEPSLPDIVSGALLFWVPPLVFGLFSNWSRRNYQWLLTIVFALTYGRVALGLLMEQRTPQTAAFSALSLSMFITIFLRLPFQHALCLSVAGYLLITSVGLHQHGFAVCLPLFLPVGMAVGLGLFAAWRTERRERSLFDKRRQSRNFAQQAQEQAKVAADAAREAKLQTEIAERATAEARAQRDLAQRATAEAHTQRDRAEREAAEAQAQSAVAAEALVEAKAQSDRAERAMAEALVAVQQRQKLFEQLQLSYSQRELMIRAIHHDVNQPLTSIGQLVFSLEHIACGNDAYAVFRPGLGAIAARAAEVDRLLRGMHNLVKLGDFVPKYEPVSVNRILRAMEERFAETARAKGLKLTVRVREKDLYLWTDLEAIERMLANLVSNAIKYTIQGQVFVGSVRQKQLLRFDVLDSGVGIPEEMKNEIYKEFVRLEQEGVEDVKGLGLGLAIVTLFRDRLDRHYLDHNSAVGKGSRFSVSVPIASSVPERIELPSDTPQALPPGKVYAALVEDEAQLRTSLTVMLQAAGYDVHDNVKAVGSVQELRNIFERFPYRAPNVVVSDYQLQDETTAKDVIALVDEYFSWQTVPVVVYTAAINPELPAGRQHMHVLAKSSDPIPLLTLIQQAISTARQDDASRESA